MISLRKVSNILEYFFSDLLNTDCKFSGIEICSRSFYDDKDINSAFLVEGKMVGKILTFGI